jgi:putative nucleotidyltransferase with HDIG domain
LADEGSGQPANRLTRARKALDVLGRVMDMSDPDTSRHSRDIEELVRRVARQLGIEGAGVEQLELAARFHDIGKVAVPEAILRKPGPLDEAEWELMVCHVEWGAELLRHLPDCEPIAAIVRHHHERYDGRGYPDGLASTRIPLGSRIIAACDAYGAMVSERPYRRPFPRWRALQELRDGVGTQFDPAVVGAVLKVAEEVEVHARLAPS